jgi:hypothetical protein
MNIFRITEGLDGFMKKIAFEYPFFVEMFSHEYVNDLIKELEESWNKEKKTSKSLRIEKQNKIREIQ